MTSLTSRSSSGTSTSYSCLICLCLRSFSRCSSRIRSKASLLGGAFLVTQSCHNKHDNNDQLANRLREQRQCTEEAIHPMCLASTQSKEVAITLTSVERHSSRMWSNEHSLVREHPQTLCNAKQPSQIDTHELPLMGKMKLFAFFYKKKLMTAMILERFCTGQITNKIWLKLHTENGANQSVKSNPKLCIEASWYVT